MDVLVFGIEIYVKESKNRQNPQPRRVP